MVNLFWLTGRGEEAFAVLVMINWVVSLCIFVVEKKRSGISSTFLR